MQQRITGETGGAGVEIRNVVRTLRALSTASAGSTASLDTGHVLLTTDELPVRSGVSPGLHRRLLRLPCPPEVL
jgi:hypothetical protein